MKNGERRIWLMGTELILRPISAAEYINAANEASALEAKYGADEETKKILKGACLTACGVFDGEERKFANGEEVLSALSVHEILFAAEEYAAKTVTRMADYEDMGQKKFAQAEEKQEAESREKPSATEENFFISLRKDVITGEIRNEKADGILHEHYGREEVPEAEGNMDIYRISEAAERDSRRYDGGFERY